MAQETNPPGHQKSAREWSKLSPAIGSAKAGDLPANRGQEPGLEPGQPAPALGVDAPQTPPLPAQTPAQKPAAADETPSDEPAAAARANEVGPAPRVAADRGPATARESAVRDRPRLLRLRRAIITLTIPVLTIMVAVRAVASPLFLWIEYHRPGFPADTYGFSTEERLRLGSYGLDYILNLAPETYLSHVQTGGKAAFQASEVHHMTDVKHVMLSATVFAVVMLVLALISARSLRLRAPGVLRSSLFAGAWLTLLTCLALALTGLLGWERFFTAFHQLFFPQGNWQFAMSDTLIRLYPPQFWVDAAATAGILILLMAGALLAITWPTHYRKQLALKRQAEREELRAKLSA
ncbi:TIGR01906 family membrane protein [Rothia nasisuis]|uniref:TIGR01906 family membrane protein n=1 Tax=Rothia nasisuis TaxID=2109647 RepID=UPI001F3559A9|nr:TIGR01906 family membrane protein [Rothia nasisuis]